MPEDNEIDKFGKKIFKPKPQIDPTTAPVTDYEDDTTRKKTFKRNPRTDVALTPFELLLKTEKKSQKTNTATKEAPTRRVSDLLKSLSKFDEDIERLRGINQTNFRSTDESIEQLSPAEMQKELKTFLLNRDMIKSNLDTLVMKVNQFSSDLEQEEEKIKKIKIQIQKEKEIGAKSGD